MPTSCGRRMDTVSLIYHPLRDLHRLLTMTRRRPSAHRPGGHNHPHGGGRVYLRSQADAAMLATRRQPRSRGRPEQRCADSRVYLVTPLRAARAVAAATMLHLLPRWRGQRNAHAKRHGLIVATTCSRGGCPPVLRCLLARMAWTRSKSSWLMIGSCWPNLGSPRPAQAALRYAGRPQHRQPGTRATCAYGGASAETRAPVAARRVPDP